MPEIAKMLVLSTGHLTRHTATRLEDGSHNGAWEHGAPIYHDKGEYGWFVWINDDHVPRTPLPNDLIQCFEYAEALGCQWIMFDRDGEQVEELPYYEW